MQAAGPTHRGGEPSQSSVAHRQRVAVARALASRADVILADEHWRRVVLDLLAAEAERGAVIVIASNDEEVMSGCDRIVTLA